ncbi:hypothetical protein BaRGS_00022765 [Batillaria attramentaria]|uniref:Uncharacterized protein n=1 Tax=Batillaria attramentaria TaxID=370345 RepID=A0ABD0KFT0_9CAEN
MTSSFMCSKSTQFTTQFDRNGDCSHREASGPFILLDKKVACLQLRPRDTRHTHHDPYFDDLAMTCRVDSGLSYRALNKFPPCRRLPIYPPQSLRYTRRTQQTVLQGSRLKGREFLLSLSKDHKLTYAPYDIKSII